MSAPSSAAPPSIPLDHTAGINLEGMRIMLTTLQVKLHEGIKEENVPAFLTSLKIPLNSITIQTNHVGEYTGFVHISPSGGYEVRPEKCFKIRPLLRRNPALSCSQVGSHNQVARSFQWI